MMLDFSTVRSMMNQETSIPISNRVSGYCLEKVLFLVMMFLVVKLYDEELRRDVLS